MKSKKRLPSIVVKGDVIMAAMKKSTTVKAVETKATEPVKKIEAAAAAKALETKMEAPEAEEKKAEAAPVQTASVKDTEKKAAKATAKSEETVTEKKKPGRKSKTAEAEKKAEAPAAQKTVQTGKNAVSEKQEAQMQVNTYLQYAGKSYSNEDLLNITKDVWQYDLKQDVKEINTVDLYVKPEENTVYYVINGTHEGSFSI